MRRAGGKAARRRLSAGLRWALLAVLAAFATEARAHNLGDSYLYLQVYEESIRGRFEIALVDLNRALGRTGTPREITAENLDEHTDFLRRYYLKHVEISAGGNPLAIEFDPPGDRRLTAGYVRLPFALGGFDRVPDSLTFDYSVLFDEAPDHRGFVLVEHNWATGTFANENRVSLVFRPGATRQELDLTTSGRLRGFLAVARLGFEHLLLGVDHVFFLAALLLPAVLRRDENGWRPVERFAEALANGLRIVTAFLLAHSLALSLAATGLVRLPAALVETAIAVSILVAAGNILFPLIRSRPWWIVFALSLFHGFGFSAALEDLGVLDRHLGLSLLAFNLGAEAGQLALAAALLPVLFLVRRLTAYRKLLLPAVAVGMILVAGVWTIERGFGVDVPLRELLPPAVQRVIP